MPSQNYYNKIHKPTGITQEVWDDLLSVHSFTLQNNTKNLDDLNNLISKAKDKNKFINFAVRYFAIAGRNLLVFSLLAKGADPIEALRGYTHTDNTKQIEFLLENELVSIDQVIFNYALAGDVDRVKEFLPKAENKLVAQNLALYGFALHDDIAEVYKLLDEGADVNEAVCNLAVAGRTTQVDDLIRNRKADINEAITGYAIVGNKPQVDLLLEKAIDKLASKNAALRGYTIGNYRDEVNVLIDRGAEINKAIYYYACAGNLAGVNDLLNKGANITPAIRGFKKRGYESFAEDFLKKAQETDEQLKRSQHKKQQKQSKIRTALVVLAAIFLTPLSLFVTLPLWYRARKKANLNNPIQKLVTTQKEVDAVKEKRKIVRDGHKKKKDYDKPKKIVYAKKNSNIVYLVDKAQLARFNLFAKQDQGSLCIDKKKIRGQVKESKVESKKIMRGLR
jgi:hypothetical protein